MATIKATITGKTVLFCIVESLQLPDSAGSVHCGIRRLTGVHNFGGNTDVSDAFPEILTRRAANGVCGVPGVCACGAGGFLQDTTWTPLSLFGESGVCLSWKRVTLLSIAPGSEPVLAPPA